MAEVRVDAETPCLQVNLDTDPLRADHQLQQALRLNASRDELTPTSRKHSRSRSNSNYSVESDLITDVSGRFDDADEFDSCGEDGIHDTVAHSVKRRRSNDWPAQNSKGQADSDRPRYHESSFGRRWRLYHESNGRKSNQNNGSPRAAASCKNGPLPRPRRSRFVEGNMNDSVSEKPPSIFLRDDWHLEGEKGANNTGASHKSSGIFRFGKAIASAFNPFGGWGNASDVWKGGSGEENQQQQQQQQQQPEDDDIARVQKAYEELKKAGFKGTVKGAYTQGAQADSSNLPDQTWKAIQEKMDYKQPSVSGRHSRQISGESQDTARSASIRTSLQELRKAKSSLGISVKNTPGRGSEDSECLDLRRQKSRKDMLRQAKLLKKVSNLEDKLTKARHELRELSGPEEEQPVAPRTMSLEAIAQEDKPYYPRKFVPGALPTLPSERCLEDQAAAEDNELSALPALTAPPSNTPQDNKHATPKSKAKSPKSKETRQSSASLTTDSPSLKRKSPDPESLGSAQVTEPNKQDNDEDQPMANSDPLTTITNITPGNRLRKAKFQKMGKGDSPGSVERKQSQERLETDDSNNNNSLLTPGTTSGPGGKGRRKPRYLNPTSPKSSPSARRSTSISTPRGESCGPSLRMKKGRSDLRSASVDTDADADVDADADADADAVGDRMDCDDDDDDSSPSNNTRQRTFYMQGEHHLDPDQNTTSPSPSKGRERRARHEYIPPVPPLPKDLAATAAKVDRRLAKELGRRKGGLRQTRERKKEDFEWPEDIF